ncbi:cytochrome c oxidase accessory protein CcoG [soil metagenome]
MSKRRLQLLEPSVLKGSLRADGTREAIHPADVKGRFARGRIVVFYLLIAVWAALPWIKIGGHPAVFLDVEHRRFHLFGGVFNSQDTPLLFFLLTGLGFTLVFVTALFGRVWCGWACPQTVFLEGVFRRLERLIEGPREQRMKRDKIPLFRKVLLHLCYVVAALLIAHVILAYFTSMPAILLMVRGNPGAHPEAFVWAAALTGILYFDFAWFREQVCLVLCPYGRLQSALIDADSMVIGYDERRGEPRGKVADTKAGDCIDCTRCVTVCPTGIDIRNGLQIDCIGCTACIDACDEIMDKVERPRGLIRYTSSSKLEGAKGRVLRPRIYAYGALLAIGGGAALLGFHARTSFEATILRLPGPAYVFDGDEVRDSFQIHVVNKTSEHHIYVIVPEERPGLTFVVPLTRVEVDAMSDVAAPVFVSVARASYQDDFDFHLTIAPVDGREGDERVVRARFVGAKGAVP